MSSVLSFEIDILSMEIEVGKLTTVRGDPEAIAIVVAENHMDRPGKALAEFLGNEWRAQVSTANDHLGIVISDQG